MENDNGSHLTDNVNQNLSNGPSNHSKALVTYPWYAKLARSVIETPVFSIALIFIIVVMIIEQNFARYAAIFFIVLIFCIISILRNLKFMAFRQEMKHFEQSSNHAKHKKKLSKHRKDYGRS